MMDSSQMSVENMAQEEEKKRNKRVVMGYQT